MKVMEAPSKTQLLEFYRQMLLIRHLEEKSAEMYTRGRIGGFLHLYIGEEAVAVGAISTLEPQDYIVSHYRDHGHALARGLDPRAVMAELFGRSTGVSKGKGGSMHLFDVSKGFLGGYAIVGGQLPVAVGLGLASAYLGQERVVLAFLGDGAVTQGEFHESLNLAALWLLPVVFLCENNGYGMGAPVSMTFAGKEIYRLADAYGVPSQQMDGMDVLAVRTVTLEAVERARAGGGPTFLEALTYRFRGHSMADPLEYRKKTEEEFWKARDPIVTFREKLLAKGLLDEAEDTAIAQEIEATVEEAVRFAEESPAPPPEALYQDIYA